MYPFILFCDGTTHDDDALEDTKKNTSAHKADKSSQSCHRGHMTSNGVSGPRADGNIRSCSQSPARDTQIYPLTLAGDKQLKAFGAVHVCLLSV